MYGCKSCNHNGNKEYCNKCLIDSDYIYARHTEFEPAEQAKVNDNVNHPSHYCNGSIEVIRYIEDKLSEEALQGYFAGNVIKYISRYKHKNGLEDLKKAAWYLERMIKNIEKPEMQDIPKRLGD